MSEITQNLSDALEATPLRFHTTILDEEYELVLPSHGWTYKEAKLAKQVSEGMSPTEIGGKFLEGDPDAMMAVIKVTLARNGKQLSHAQEQRLEDTDLEAINRALLEAIKAKLNEPDPPKPATAGPPEQNGNEPSEPPLRMVEASVTSGP